MLATLTLAFVLPRAALPTAVASPVMVRGRGSNLLLLLLGMPHLMREHKTTRHHVPLPHRRARR